MPSELVLLLSRGGPSVDVALAVLAIALPGLVALVPSVLGVLVLPAPVGVIYRIHHHRHCFLLLGWAAALLLLLRAASGAVPLGGVLAVEGIVVFLTVFYLALYPGRVFAPVTAPERITIIAADQKGAATGSGEEIAPEDEIAPDEEVVGLLLGGEARAYTLTTLIRSHLVLDRDGDDDLAVSYCSLSSTGSALRSRGRRLRAVTAVDNNVILYDESSGDLVHQAACRVVCGPGAGSTLESVPVVLTRWRVWRRLFPDTRVCHVPPRGFLDRHLRTAMLRMHHRVAGLAKPFHPLSFSPDPRLPPMARVLGVAAGGAARAYPLDGLPAPAVLDDRLGGEPLVILSERRGGPLTCAFSRRLGGRELTFELSEVGSMRDALATDRQTRSLWNAAGRAIAGPLQGHQLTLLPQHQSAFWFAWTAVHPGTEVVAPSLTGGTSRRTAAALPVRP